MLFGTGEHLRRFRQSTGADFDDVHIDQLESQDLELKLVVSKNFNCNLDELHKAERL